MVDRNHLREPSPDDGSFGVPAADAAAIEEITGWDQGLAYVERILGDLVAERAAAAIVTRTTARAMAVDEAQSRALAYVVGEAVRAALLADTARAEARLELAELVHRVRPLREVAAEVAAQLDDAVTKMQAGLAELAALVAKEVGR